MGTIGVFTDISERTRAEAIQQAVTGQRRTTSNILSRRSKRIPTPPSPPRAGAVIDLDRVVQGLSAIDASTSTMERLIDAMVDAARLRAGHHLTLQRQQIDLVALVSQAIDTTQQTTDAHAISLKTNVPALVGEWDAPRLERVLSNVLSNAIKYSPRGRPICVRVDARETETTPWVVVTVPIRAWACRPPTCRTSLSAFTAGRMSGASQDPGLG